MNEAFIVLQQIVIMFLLIGVGIVSRKMKLIDSEGTKPIADVLLTIVLPGLIIKSYQRELILSQLAGLGSAFVIGILIHGVAVILSQLMIPKRKSREYILERFCTVYPNVAFMSFPLFYAIMGDIGVFYGTSFVAASIIFTWTHGVILLNRQNKPGLLKLIVNPGIIGLLISLVLYFTQLPLPGVLKESLNHVASLNTPLAMIITGIFLADVDVPSMFRDLHIFRVVGMRLIAVPLIILLILKLSGFATWTDWSHQVQIVSLISSGCPTAAFTIMFTAKFGHDGGRAAKIVALTTALSVITIPIFTYLGG